ncbi:MAG: hypothetical protein U5R06_21070 [candidate division KSB1 bacterium]|nr:hypothetical protein [candidate division KSB1 bacterium]
MTLLQDVQTTFEQDPFVFFLWSRIFVALLGVLTVFSPLPYRQNCITAIWVFWPPCS